MYPDWMMTSRSLGCTKSRTKLTQTAAAHSNYTHMYNTDYMYNTVILHNRLQYERKYLSISDPR